MGLRATPAAPAPSTTRARTASARRGRRSSARRSINATRPEPAIRGRARVAIHPSPTAPRATTATPVRRRIPARAGVCTGGEPGRLHGARTSATPRASATQRPGSAPTQRRPTGRPATMATHAPKPTRVKAERVLVGTPSFAPPPINAIRRGPAIRQPESAPIRPRPTGPPATTATPARRPIPARAGPAWAAIRLSVRRSTSAIPPGPAIRRRGSVPIRRRRTARSCDDGNPCTSGDTCQSGTCSPGTTITCSVANGTGACNPSTGTCEIAACNPGFSDCDFTYATGCDTNTDTNVNHCGGCFDSCPTDPHGVVTCVDGGCVLTCNGGYTNCNGHCCPAGHTCCSDGSNHGCCVGSCCGGICCEFASPISCCKNGSCYSGDDYCP